MQLLKLSGMGLCLAASAAAQITSIGPFAGDHSEGFETQPTSPPFVQCITNRVFNGTADLCGANGNNSMHIATGWSFVCSIQPHSGGKLFGSTGDPARFTFDADVNEFGGYFGTNSWDLGNPANHTVTVDFFDRMGNSIGSELAIVTADCQYTWNGWASTTGIASIVITNSAFGGGFVNLDDLEVRIGGSSSLGTSYCGPAVLNTANSAAEITATGSDSAAANDLTLNANDMPSNQFGFFLTSMTQGLVTNPGGSQGNLCLGGVVGRYVRPGQVQNAGPNGSFSLLLDLTQTPAGGAFVSINAGQTWNFQAWFRDTGPLGEAWSNFTDARSITFN